VGSRRYDSVSMEGQFFFTTVAGVSVSLAGFASLIAALREDSRTWTIAMASSAVYAALKLVNLSLANLGILQLGFLLMLIEPAGIFSNFVRELGRQRREPELLGEAIAEG
jgi:hypothetical protein